MNDGERSRFPTVKGGQTDAVAIGEDGDVGGRELGHLVGDGQDW